MKFEHVQRKIGGIPYITPHQAKRLYSFLLSTRPRECLELGFGYGASTCYAAAALDELGRGQITAVDLAATAGCDPNLEQLLDRLDLSQYVNICREPNSYTWHLKKELEAQTTDNHCEPKYDFCYIDGPKNWTIDGCAFFLVDKLLREGGWVLFDDLNWTHAAYAKATGRDATDGVTHRTMAPDEFIEPHIEAVFRLLVMQHPNYGEFRLEEESWGFARKVKSDARTLTVNTYVSLPYRFVSLARRLRKWISNRYSLSAS